MSTSNTLDTTDIRMHDFLLTQEDVLLNEKKKNIFQT